jgi:hypothetical protein
MGGGEVRGWWVDGGVTPANNFYLNREQFFFLQPLMLRYGNMAKYLF